MYSKDELLSKDVAELESIAGQLGAKIKSGDSQEDIVYSILDKQAEVEGSKNPLGTKRRRVRIVKKDTDRVYSVNGKEGENDGFGNHGSGGCYGDLLSGRPGSEGDAGK